MNIELLKKFTGEEIPFRIKDMAMRRAFVVNWTHMAANYGPGVDAELLYGQILLCDETWEVLYEKPDPVRYKKGTRPVLERVAREAVTGASSETECAIAIMRFTRDLYKKHKGWHPFFGGTEEVLIEKGEELCECVARLEVALLEVLGIPARIITHTVGGHVTAEVYADGKWGYIDPRCGMYFLLEDGRLASLWELIHDHSILDRQTDAVRADVSDRWQHAERIRALKEKYLSAGEVNSFKYYSLADADKYNYSWMTDEKCIDLNMNLICTEYGRARNAVMFPEKLDSDAKAYSVRFTLPDGVTLREDVMLGVRVTGVMCHPQVAHFYIDGTPAYSSSPTVPVSELSTFQHGIILFGGAGGSLPVSTLEDGKHTLSVEICISPTYKISDSIDFFVKKK